jgi:23S rRNA (guanosine2251-2'-O)-methyltransferase
MNTPNKQPLHNKLGKMLTIYGRKACEEALLDNSLNVYKLHLADSNKKAAILDHCIGLAKKRGIEVSYHDKRSLSFISKNAKQDQGIALDIELEQLNPIGQLNPEQHKKLLLLDNITNPQNIGMILRSAAAGFIDGIIIPEKGCAELGPLVIKASTGAIFKAPIFRCKNISEALNAISTQYHIYGLSLETRKSFYETTFNNNAVFILGNESTGISQQSQNACNSFLKIPMNNGIESLNVAVTAALVAFHPSVIGN